MVTIQDMVRAQALLLDHLGVETSRRSSAVPLAGCKRWSGRWRYPDRLKRCVIIGAAPVGAMALAMGHLQRQAIRNDPAWQGGRYAPDHQPAAGLALARALAMCTYKSAELFEERYARKPNRAGEDPYTTPHGRFDVCGYLDYQGQIFVRRFDANTYLVISKAMDAYDLGPTPEEEAEKLRRITAEVLMVGISSDWLFPPQGVRSLAQRMRAAGVKASYAELESSHGHDGFLADMDRLVALVVPALKGESFHAALP